MRPVLFAQIQPYRLHLAAFAPAQVSSDPCPECLAMRLCSYLELEEQTALHQGFCLECGDAPFLLPGQLECIATLADHLLRTVAKQRPFVYTVDLLTSTSTRHELMADSFCGRCSTLPDYSCEAARLPLRSHVPAAAGGGRVKHVREYDLPLGALVNLTCGAVARGTFQGQSRTISVPTFGQYFQRSFTGYGRVASWGGFHSRRADGLMAGVLDTFTNLVPHAMDPALLLAYNDASYALPFGLTRYSVDLPLDWVWGFSLSSRQPILVPRQLAFYATNARGPQGKAKVVDNNSSGCALGSCYEEAILKGLLELIERDSFVIAWHQQMALPRFDPDSWRTGRVRSLLDRVELLGYDLTLLDGRLDMEVPTVIAIARRRDRELGAMTVGAAANMDLEDAVCSAMLEACSSIVELPAMIRADEEHIRSLPQDFLRVKTVADHSTIYGLPEMADRIGWLWGSPHVQSAETAASSSSRWSSSGDIAIDLERCLAELRRHGCREVIAVDQTTREQRQLGLVTVRVLAPGLAPIDFGHPRNRVQHLPRMRLDERLRAMRVDGDRLNPLPHPFP
jgi:ribosomal protein S12 methylthiotransferase accessory factor